jgi:hypothetical protein
MPLKMQSYNLKVLSMESSSADLDIAILLVCEGEHITVETIPDQCIIDIYSPAWGKISCS